MLSKDYGDHFIIYITNTASLCHTSEMNIMLLSLICQFFKNSEKNHLVTYRMVGCGGMREKEVFGEFSVLV